MAYRKRTSPIWEFFEPPTVTEVNGKDVKRVQCLLCTQQLADGGGMSNLMSHLQAKNLKEYKRCTNDSSKSCKTQMYTPLLLAGVSTRVCYCHHKRIAEFVARDLHRVGFWAGHSFLYENLLGRAVFILQLSVCFTFRISGCRKPTSIAALVIITAATANAM